jgi:hypothetical protein
LASDGELDKLNSKESDMRCSLLCVLLLGLLLSSASGLADSPRSSPKGALTATRQGSLIAINGSHFRIRVDAARGGEITGLELFDGADWNRVLGGDKQTCPMICFAAKSAEYRVANNSRARVSRLDASPELVRFDVLTTTCDAAGRALPWKVRLGYRVYREGVLFIDVDWELPAAVQDRWVASVSFAVDRAICRGAKYRQEAVAVPGDPAAFESARLAFGADPELSYTNEIQAILEEKKPLAGVAEFRSATGRFTWSLSDGKTAIRGPIRYHNRFCLALGSGAIGWRRTNLVGQRVYHWINLVKKSERGKWYPTKGQIDKMADHHATILVLHQNWLLHGGWNNDPHADYRVASDENALRRTIAHAHSRGMRVGLYCRGSERYSVESGFFAKYCQRDWDGLYVDWNSPHCIANHEHAYPANAAIQDRHISVDGSCLPAREYFLFLRRLREIVGPRGFLIGHQGIGAAGVLPNLVCDAFLPGEAISDRTMFADVDQAVYRGMLGGGVCHPWPLESPAFTSSEGIAKMAAWGFYPHVGLGMQRAADKLVFPLDPDEKVNEFALPYWRILAAFDMRGAKVFNLPNQNPVASVCSAKDFRAVVYKNGDRGFLVILANLGTRPAKTRVKLLPKVLGMSGSYSIQRVDSRSGLMTRHATATARFESAVLPQWGIEGYRFTKEPTARAVLTPGPSPNRRGESR